MLCGSWHYIDFFLLVQPIIRLDSKYRAGILENRLFWLTVPYDSDFLGYCEKIPFVKPAPIDQEESKKQKKQKAGQQKKTGEGASGDAVTDGVSNMKIDQ